MISSLHCNYFVLYYDILGSVLNILVVKLGDLYL